VKSDALSSFQLQLDTPRAPGHAWRHWHCHARARSPTACVFPFSFPHADPSRLNNRIVHMLPAANTYVPTSANCLPVNYAADCIASIVESYIRRWTTTTGIS
jgi:hypothetical protein